MEMKVITCPECKGTGEVAISSGLPHGIPYWTPKFFEVMEYQHPGYKDQVIRIEGYTSKGRCGLCQGNRLVYVAPAQIVKNNV